MSFLASINKLAAVAAVLKQLLGLIVDTIQIVEQQFGPGRGKEKLAAVRAVITAAIDRIDGLTIGIDDIWPRIASIIEAFVAIYNSSGIFRKSAPPAPAPAPAPPPG